MTLQSVSWRMTDRAAPTVACVEGAPGRCADRRCGWRAWLRRALQAALCAILVVAAACIAPQKAAANPSMEGIAAVTAALTGWAATHPASAPPGGAAWVVSAGAFDRVDRVDQSLSLGLERRWGGFVVWRLKPFAGVAVTNRRSLYLYGGLRLGLNVLSRMSIEPSFAIANYYHGGGKDLGSPIEFRSGIDIEWRFPGGMRAGLAYHHMSHWILFGSENPGTEILALTLSVPVR